MADAAKIHIRTYVYLETGNVARFKTLERIMDAAQASPLMRASIVRAWIEQQVGEENWRLIHSRHDEQKPLIDQIIQAVKALKSEDQQDLLAALQSPQVVSCLKKLNEIARIASQV